MGDPRIFHFFSPLGHLGDGPFSLTQPEDQMPTEESHGWLGPSLTGYRKGCRCTGCRSEKSQEQAQYRLRQKLIESGAEVPTREPKPRRRRRRQEPAARLCPGCALPLEYWKQLCPDCLAASARRKSAAAYEKKTQPSQRVHLGRHGTEDEHFWIKVVKSSTCWDWVGANNKGYGIFRGQRAHRWAYEHTIGPIPDGLTIDHLCMNRSCVNPAHMEPVSRSENSKRAAISGKELHV